MAGLSFDDLIPKAAPIEATGGLSFDDLIPAATAARMTVEPRADGKKPRSEMGWGEWAADMVTGAKSTEFPDAPEFMPSYLKATGGRYDDALASISRSAVTPDENAQLDIIRTAIPGLQSKKDALGNLMLKSPEMADFAYLNKPGVSARDMDELGTGTLVTLPFGAALGLGKTLLGRFAIGGGAAGAGSVAQDAIAIGEGSEQGVDPLRAGVSTGIGGILGPLVGSRAPKAAPDLQPAPPAAVPPPAAATAAPEQAPVAAAPVAAGAPELSLPTVAKTEADAPVASAPAIPDKVVTPDGSMELAAKPVLVELDTLKLARGDLQPRDRSRSEYLIASRERAAQLDPEQLLPNRVSDTGAPIIRPDGTILSGNGRVISINEVYSSPELAERAAAYRAKLGPAAQGMRQPVLVMRTGSVADDEAAKFADLSNRGRVAAMSATERASRDAKALGPDTLALYQGGEFDAPQNLPFLRAFSDRAVTAGERTAFSRDNRLTKEGVDRMRSAVLASAFPDAATIFRMVESADDNIRNITGALTDVAPKFAKLKADIAAGVVPTEMDPTQSISDAVRIIGDLRNRGVSPAQHYAQSDAFASGDALADQWVKAFYTDDLSRPISREKMTAVMDAFAEEAAKKQSGGLFADPTTATDVLGAARRVAGNAGKNAQGGSAPGVGAGVSIGGGQVQRPAAPASGGGAPPGGGQGAGNGGSVPPGNGSAGAAGPQGLGPGPRTPGLGQRPIIDMLGADAPAAVRSPTRERLAEAANRQGIDVPNVVGRGMLAKSFAGGLAGLVTGTPLVAASRKAIEQLGEKAVEIAAGYGRGSSYSAGEVAKNGLTAWITGRSADVSKRLFENVGRLVDKTKTLPLATTRKLVDELEAAQFASASKFNQRAIDLVLEAVNRQGGLTYEGQIGLRQALGNLLDGSVIPEPGTPMPAIKRLYGAVTEDLRRTVSQLGNKEAVEAFDRANRVTQLVANRREDLAKIIGEKADAPPERVLDKILAMASSKGSADATRLLQARRALGADGWDEVAGAAVLRLGHDTSTAGGAGLIAQASENFNPAKFVREYSALTSNGRAILFKSTGKDSLKESLDDIATVSTKMTELARFSNPSGTARSVQVGAVVGGGYFVSPLATLAGVGLSYALALALAKPMTAKAVSRWSNAYFANASAPAKATAAMLTLAGRNLAHALAEADLGDEAELEQRINSGGSGGNPR